MTKFNDWFKENLTESAKDISEHGADAGYPCITYTSDTVEIYDKFESDIYEMLNDDADDMGYDNVESLISTFGRSDMLSWPEGRKNLLVWYACERRAHELHQ
jgi:hypothetical protein